MAKNGIGTREQLEFSTGNMGTFFFIFNGNTGKLVFWSTGKSIVEEGTYSSLPCGQQISVLQSIPYCHCICVIKTNMYAAYLKLNMTVLLIVDNSIKTRFVYCKARNLFFISRCRCCCFKYGKLTLPEYCPVDYSNIVYID